MSDRSFQPLLSDGQSVEGKVKFFDGGKGFGFVILPDGASAFLHISALQAAGHQTVAEGATVRCEVGAGKKGPQVTRVIEIVTAASPPPRARDMPRADLSNVPGTVEIEGVVKWFSVERGYGFVTMDDGGDNVFVHGDYMRRSGIPSLATDQRVQLSVIVTAKGREARRVLLLDTPL